MVFVSIVFFFFFSSRRRHTRCSRDWSSDVCSSDLPCRERGRERREVQLRSGVHFVSSKAHALDELDRKIIAVLAEDGRISNRKIAAALGVTEGTIRGRIKRLEDENCIRLTAVTNISSAGWPRVALIGIHAAHSELESLCQKLAAMSEVGCVILCLGRFDILAIGLFKTLE